MTTEQFEQKFGQLIPIPSRVHEQLNGLLNRLSPEQVQRIRPRAIAVWVVARYLNRFGYDCNWEASSVWNPVLQVLTDFAELEVFEGDRRLGIVECIPLAAEAEALEIPEQVALGDRMAYIAVEVNPQNTWGTIVGVAPAVETEFPELIIEREEFLSTDALLDLLEVANPLLDEALLAELQAYWTRHGQWSEEQRQGAIAQLERAFVLEDVEILRVETAAQELETLIYQSVGQDVPLELAFKEEDDSLGGDRLELREILKRLFQSLREDLDEDIG